VGGTRAEDQLTEALDVGPFESLPVQVHPYDPRLPVVAARVSAAIRAALPGAEPVHFGSSAVPGLAGKNVVDLELECPAGALGETVEALAALGFAYAPDLAAPPAGWHLLRGSLEHEGERFRVHVHVLPAGSAHARGHRHLRDLLRADPALCDEYVALKRSLVARGITQPQEFSVAKGPWMAGVFRRFPMPSVRRSRDADGLDGDGARALVREAYDRVSYAYRADDGDDAREGAWAKRVDGRLAAGSDVLDLGCGCGVPVARLLAARHAVTGVDISPVQIARARRLVPGARFVCADMTEVEHEPASFDAVVALYSLVHVPLDEQRLLYARIAGWLRADGLLLATVGASRYRGIEEGWLDVEGADVFFDHADAATHVEMLRTAGFDVERVEHAPEGDAGQTLVEARAAARA
jgi:GrpB-like predicted nucleotidyltransferase (UPF0157 family)/protein-L-isoaspartate O-methyltransferase